MGYEANRRVETSAKTFAIVERMRDVGSVGVSELAAQLETNKGIVHNHVSTLRELGYVEKVGEKYRLSARFFGLGWSTRERIPLYRFGATEIDPLANRLGATVLLGQRCGDVWVVLDVSETASWDGFPLGIGDEFDLFSTLPGLVLLGAGSGRTRERAGRDDRVPDSYDAESVFANVADEGYATGDLTTSSGLACVSVPIVEESIDIGGVMVAASANRSAKPIGQDSIADMLEVRRRIEERFKYDWDDDRSFATVKHDWVTE